MEKIKDELVESAPQLGTYGNMVVSFVRVNYSEEKVKSVLLKLREILNEHL